MYFIGNKKAVDLLMRSLKNGTLNHAYIFSGPEKVGKFTLAKMFALAAIKGTDVSNEIEYDKEALLDLLEVRPEVVEKNGISKKKDISVESIREAKSSLSLFPYYGKYKVLIIDDAHKLNMAAQNALLKVFEEPNQTTIIILVTHEIDRILPTIISRAQMVNFQLVKDEELEKDERFQAVAGLAIGRPGFANEMLDDPEKKSYRLEAKNKLEKILTGSLNEKFALADEFSKNVFDALSMMDIWIWEMRRKALDGSETERMKIFAQVENIQKTMTVLKRTNSNTKLVLETLFMDL